MLIDQPCFAFSLLDKPPHDAVIVFVKLACYVASPKHLPCVGGRSGRVCQRKDNAPAAPEGGGGGCAGLCRASCGTRDRPASGDAGLRSCRTSLSDLPRFRDCGRSFWGLILGRRPCRRCGPLSSFVARPDQGRDGGVTTSAKPERTWYGLRHLAASSYAPWFGPIHPAVAFGLDQLDASVPLRSRNFTQGKLCKLKQDENPRNFRAGSVPI